MMNILYGYLKMR